MTSEKVLLSCHRNRKRHSYEALNWKLEYRSTCTNYRQWYQGGFIRLVRVRRRINGRRNPKERIPHLLPPIENDVLSSILAKAVPSENYNCTSKYNYSSRQDIDAHFLLSINYFISPIKNQLLKAAIELY